MIAKVLNINSQQLLICGKEASVVMKVVGKNREGFTLIITILALVILFILGFSILGVSTSNYKMTKIDSKSQSAYYIAEAGINYMTDKINKEIQENGTKYNTSTEFFQYIENQFTKNTFSIDSFEKNNGEQPKTLINVTLLTTDEDTRDYKIESEGKIGKSRRKVNTVISIDWIKRANNVTSDLILNTKKFAFNGSNFNAPGKTIVISGQDATSMNGGSNINVKNIYFKELKDGVISGKSFGDENNPGNIYLDGNAHILSSGRTMYGNVHTNGDFIVTGGVDIYGDLFVGGRFEVAGGSNIYGDLYVKEDFQIKGGATIHGDVYAFNGIDANGGGKIKGNLNVEGKSKLVNITVEKASYINGNLELGWTPIFKQNVYYTGILTKPNSYSQEIMNKCEQVQNVPSLNLHDYSFTIPHCTATLNQDNWYEEKGYEVMKGTIVKKISKNAKWLVDNYYNTDYQNIDSEVVIISKKDIILRGGSSFKGVLIAPNGIVKYTGGDFEGVVISNNEVSLSGWGQANIRDLEEYFETSDIPVNFDCEGSSEIENNNESKDNIRVQIAIKSKIKEE